MNNSPNLAPTANCWPSYRLIAQSWSGRWAVTSPQPACFTNLSTNPWTSICNRFPTFWLVTCSYKTTISSRRFNPARSLSLASDHQVRRDAALNLARAYLLNNDPYSANKVLFENFDLINTSQRSSVVGFLSSFARYLGTSDKVSQSKARERLMISLIMIKDSDLETIFDKLIASRAYSEMGLIQRSNQLLKLAENENSVDRWRRKIEFQLAIQQFDDIDDHQAIKILSRLAKDASDSVGQNAALRLAKYELHHNQYQACLKRCHLLTQTASDQQIIIEALKVMGSAYRRLGQHRSAAVCFSGMVPELFVSQSNPAQNPEGPTQQ